MVLKYGLLNYIEQFLGDDLFPSKKRWTDLILLAIKEHVLSKEPIYFFLRLSHVFIM